MKNLPDMLYRIEEHQDKTISVDLIPCKDEHKKILKSYNGLYINYYFIISENINPMFEFLHSLNKIERINVSIQDFIDKYIEDEIDAEFVERDCTKLFDYLKIKLEDIQKVLTETDSYHNHYSIQYVLEKVNPRNNDEIIYANINEFNHQLIDFKSVTSLKEASTFNDHYKIYNIDSYAPMQIITDLK